MNKDLIVSYDDIYEGNDNWEEFEKLHQEFPELKITFFVITGGCSEEFLKKIKQSWSQLVFHSWEHSGHWQKWSVEETKEWLLKYQSLGFEKGFKAPGWKITENIIKACQELDFWICTPQTIPVNVKQFWYTYPKEGLREYDKYDEFYDHIQHQHYDGAKWIEDKNVFFENLNKLKEYCRNNESSFKFISEVLKTNDK